MTTLGVTVPFYGGGQVANPANVIYPDTTPSSNLKVRLGTIAIQGGSAYMAVAATGGSTTWAPIGGGSSEVSTINGLSPVGGNIIIAGTANQVAVGFNEFLAQG